MDVTSIYLYIINIYIYIYISKRLKPRKPSARKLGALENSVMTARNNLKFVFPEDTKYS